MANGSGSGRRRSQNSQTPQRVENAASTMSNASFSGPYRGYVPPVNGMMNGQPQRGMQPPMQNEAPYGGYTEPGWQQPGMQRGARYQTGSQPNVGAHRGYIAAPPSPPTPVKKHHRKGLLIFVILLLALVLGAGGAAAYKSYQKTREINSTVEPYLGLFCPNVYVDGIPLEGMTPEQALNSVESQIRQRNDAWSVQLVYEGQLAATINAEMLSMKVDVGAVLNEAWSKGHTGTYEERYQAMHDLQENPYYGYTSTPSGDNSVIDQMLSGMKSKIDLPAADAALVSFDPSLAYPFVFSDEVYGRSLNTEPIIRQLYEMVSEMRSGTVEIKPDILYPNVLREDLQKHYSLRSSVYTQISTSSPEERNKNIERALELVNGYVLEPGKNFSFNGVVGQRTEENGFLPAVEYAYNEHVIGIGGGVCQASTTIYQAAVTAGLKIVHREKHSDRVNYTDYGKDATVYWNGKRKIDLVLRNNTEGNIYFVAGLQEDPGNRRRKIAKVSLYGEDLGDTRYELVTEVVSELEPPDEPKYVKDTEGTYVTYTDQQKSVKGEPGYVVKSYRYEYTGNVLTDRTDLATDVYDAKPERIYVGVTKRE